MYKKSNNMSELEQEFELEMDDLEMDDFEMDDSELDDSETDDFEFEADEESDNDYEYEMESENDSQGEYEWLETSDSGYAERFFELSQREFESESEIDEAVNEILDDMENEYFLGGLFKKAKGIAQNLAKKGVALAKKAGINLPSIEALKSMLGPVAGLLKGNLGALVKPALKAALAAHPAGMAALPALKALGFESSEDMGENREAWNNYVSVAQEAFEHLAANINENADNPLEASRLATNAFQTGLKNVKGRRRFMPNRGFMPNRKQVRDHRNRKVRHIFLHPGEVLVIKRKGRSL